VRTLRGPVVLACALVLAGCGAPPPTPALRAGPIGSWGAAAAWPQADWSEVRSAWTGREVVVVGSAFEIDGTMLGGIGLGLGLGLGTPDPTGAGAGAYDPARNEWRAISRPPFTLYHTSLAVLDDSVYAFATWSRSDGPFVEPARRGTLRAWSAARNEWLRLPAPPDVDGRPVWGGLLTAGRLLILAGSVRRDDRRGEREPVELTYDPATRTWSRLPDFPRDAVGDDPTVLGLPDGRLVAVGAPDSPPKRNLYDLPPPRLWRAAILDPGADSWRTLPPSPIAVGERDRLGGWGLVGGVVINTVQNTGPVRDKLSSTPRGAARDALRDALPALPTGGALDVDTGTWSLLPERPPSTRTPEQQAAMNWADAVAGDLVIEDGWAYDARRRTWAELPPVPSAPLGLGNPVLAWTGDRLFAWAHVAVASRDGTPETLDKVGWVWTPPPG
jgi:hypothetical protein